MKIREYGETITGIKAIKINNEAGLLIWGFPVRISLNAPTEVVKQIIINIEAGVEVEVTIAA